MELVTLLISLAALAWVVILVPRVPMALLAFFVLIVGTVFGPSFFAIDGPLAISVDRILWVGMLGVFFGLHVLGLRRCNIKLNRLDWLLIAFVGYLLLSTQLGESPRDGSVPLARWIFYVFMPFGMYVVARFSPISARDISWLKVGLIAFGIYLAITAMAEILGIRGLIFPQFIADPQYLEFYGRARGPLLNPSGNGFLLTVTCCCILLMFQQSSRLGKYGFAILTVVSLGGVYATLTRSVWMSVAFAAILLLLRQTPRPLRIWAVAASAVLVASLTFGLGDKILNLKRDKHLPAQASAESIELRPLLAVVAFEIAKDHPVLGVGYGHYSAYSDRYAQSSLYDMPLRKTTAYMQHNVFLSYMVDSGIIGSGLFLILFIGWSLQAWRIASNHAYDHQSRTVGMLVVAALAGYFVNGMFQDVSVIPMVNMYLFYFAGLAGAIESTDGKLPQSSTTQHRFASFRHSRQTQPTLD